MSGGALPPPYQPDGVYIASNNPDGVYVASNNPDGVYVSDLSSPPVAPQINTQQQGYLPQRTLPTGAYPTQQANPYPPPPPPGPQYSAQYGGIAVVPLGQPMFGEAPQQVVCPTCKQTVTTQTNYKIGTAVWLACVMILFFGGWIGCCLIPFCINALKDVEHYCPTDKTFLGCYNRLR